MFRKNREISVVGRNIPKPCQSFEECCIPGWILVYSKKCLVKNQLKKQCNLCLTH